MQKGKDMDIVKILEEIRKGVIERLLELTAGNTCFIFSDENKVYTDLAVGYPDESGHYDSVVKVFQKNGEVVLTLEDIYGDKYDISVNKICPCQRIFIEDLVYILDAIEKSKVLASKNFTTLNNKEMRAQIVRIIKSLGDGITPIPANVAEILTWLES